MKKMNIRSIRNLLILLVIVIISCEKSEKEKENEYLVSYENLRTITSDQIKTLLSSMTGLSSQIQSIIDNSVYDVSVYKVVYKTTFKGSDINASGLICVPEATGDYPLLSFQNGTNTAHSRAPSVNILDPLYSFLHSLAGNGYIILIPDYIGFGESSGLLHPYHHRPSSDAAIIDLIKASEEFFDSGTVLAKSNNKLFLMGYSQGAWATISALESITHSGDLKRNEVVAISCGAGGYDLYGMAKYIIAQEEYPAPFYLPYFAQSHIQHELLTGSLNQYFNEPYASRIPTLFDGEKVGSAINSQLSPKIDQLLTEKIRTNFDTDSEFQSLRDELTRNSVQAWASDPFMLFVHGTADDNVPPSQSENMYNAFLQSGAQPNRIKLMLLPEKNHDTGIIPWGLETLAHFNVWKK
jgi:pimeloyl-ACP methyl ester carboxylesterase